MIYQFSGPFSSTAGMILITLTLPLFGIRTAQGQRYNEVKLKNGHTAFTTLGATLIFDLKEHGSKAELLFFNENCIVLGRGKKIDWLIASTEFDPGAIPKSLQRRFDRIQIVTLMKMSGNIDTRDTLTYLPSWLFALSELKALELNNFIISDSSPINDLMITYLILKDCKVDEMKRFINRLRKNMRLNFLIHRDIFTIDDITWIEAQMPGIKVISDADAAIGIEEDGMKYTIRMPN